MAVKNKGVGAGASDDGGKERFVVRGRITQRVGEGERQPEKVVVRAYARELRSEALLGEVTVDKDGRYRIEYTRAGKGDGGGKATHLSIRAFTPGGTRLGESAVRFNAKAEEVIDLEVQPVAEPAPSEFESLVERVRPALGDLAHADLSDEDVAFLEHDLSIERQKVERLRRSARLARETRLPAELLYSLAPSEQAFDLEDLLKLEPAELQTAVEQAVRANTIPAHFKDEHGLAADRIEQLKLEKGLLVRHSATGKLVDKSDGSPLTALVARVFDLSARPKPFEVASAVTDKGGLFSFGYVVPREAAERRAFQVRVHDRKGVQLAEARVEVEPGSKTTVSVEVTLPAPAQNSPKLAELVWGLRLRLPREIRNVLRVKKVATLSDVLALGGLRQLPELDGHRGSAALKLIDQHAQLSILPTDIKVNAALIEHGYASVHAIVGSTLKEIEHTVQDKLKAAQIHLAANKQVRYFDNLFTDYRVNLRNGQATPLTSVMADTVSAQACQCQDCQSAVSPLAYLADLLHYAVVHVKDNGSSISANSLQSKFHQPFDELPTSCASAREQLRQVRLAVEVLRSIPKPPAGVPEAVKSYVLEAYKAFLVQVGTSYDELRLARLASADEREALRERLAIKRGDGTAGDELTRLLLAPNQLSELSLARLFGLHDTLPVHRFCRGAKLSDPLKQLKRWALTNVVWGRTTDVNGRVWLRASVKGSDVAVEVYRRPTLNTDALIAVGQTADTSGSVGLTEKNWSGVSGEVRVDTSVSNPWWIEIAAVPEFLSWRLNYLRARWSEQDWPRDAYTGGTVPVLDPDLIGPDDFRQPEKANPAFKLWLKRRQWVDKSLAMLRSKTFDMVDGQKVPNLKNLLRVMSVLWAYDGTTIRPWVNQPSWGELEYLQEKLASGTELEQTTRLIEQRLHLAPEGVRRLIEVKTKAVAWARDRANEAVTEGELEELFSILVQAAKRVFFARWCEEERAIADLFSPRFFWLSIREPRDGVWPTVRPQGQPWLDPDAINENDLPESSVGSSARQLLTARRNELESLRQAVEEEREARGLLSALQLALGAPPAGSSWADVLDTNRANLDSPDPAQANDARELIRTLLHMSEDDFRLLVALKAKEQAGQADPSRRPTADEWRRLCALLTRVKKEVELFPEWIEAESGLTYWNCRQASLPLWRASLQRRWDWQQALRARMRVPFIDPDLVTSDDLIAPTQGHPAYDLWNARRIYLRGRSRDLRDWGVSLQVIHDQLAALLGVSDLDGLKESLDSGELSTARIEQFNLKRSELEYALIIRELAKSDSPLGEEELGNFYDILLQIEKRRFLFPKWLREEQAAGLTLGPDFFQPEPALFQLPLTAPPITPQAAPAPVNPWRTDPAARRAWEATLESRVEQEQSLINAHSATVSAVEEATLPRLRDELIKLVADSADLPAAAKQLTDEFLLDMAVGGCRLTTRVSQAIETLQVLIWSLRTGQLQDTYPNLELAAEDFDEEWKWLGSYATWRAAMMVFLYPENVLLPSLRRRQTPAFRQLAERLRGNLRLTPADALEAANEYAIYFRDVCSLVLEATCEASTWAPASSGYASGPTEAQSDYRNLFYMFARSSVSRKYYWSTYDLDGQGDYRQTFWEPMPGLENFNPVRIIGAAPHRLQDGSRYIYLFIEGREPLTNRRTLGYLKYNLEQGTPRWGGELRDLSISLVIEGFDILQSGPADNSPIFLSQTASEEVPLQFAMKVGGLVLGNQLNEAGDDWAYEQWREWEPLRYHRLTRPDRGLNGIRGNLIGFVQNRFFFQHPITQACRAYSPAWLLYEYETIDDLSSEIPLLTGVFNHLGYGAWRGAVAQRDDGPILAFVQSLAGLYITLSLSHDSRTAGLSPFDLGFPWAAAGSNIPTHNGQVRTSHVNFANQGPVPQGPAPFLNRLTWDGQTNRLTKESSVRVAPQLPEANVEGSRVSLEDATRLGPLSSNEASAIRKAYTEIAFNRSYGTDSVSSRSRSVLAHIEEAYYFLPVLVALSLCKSGEYLAALDWFRNVYNYSAPREQRKVYYGLTQEQELSDDLVRWEDWLSDPLNPHEIASTRANTYTRFTLLSLLRCLLDYADAEFTQDTVESNAWAGRLYSTALELLDEPELKQSPNDCDLIIGELIISIDARMRPQTERFTPRLRRLDSLTLVGTVERLKKVWATKEPVEERLREMRRVVAEAPRSGPASATLGDLSKRTPELAAQYAGILLKHTSVAATARQLGASADDTKTLTYTYQPGGVPRLDGTSDGTYTLSPTQASPVGVPSYHFCVPPNPLIGALRLRAELNLYKIRTCRNIAGLERQLEPYAAPTDTISGLPSIGDGGQLVLPGAVRIQPTQYRYRALIERARQLAGIAQQMEATFLSLLERRDAESLNLLKARQDTRMARAGVRLQDLRVQEADEGVELARLQKELSVIQDEHYTDLLSGGLLDEEEWAVGLLWAAMGFHFGAAAVQSGGAIAAGFATARLEGATALGVASAVLDRSGGILSSIAAGLSSWSAALSTIASQKRREEDWRLQQKLARQNIQIGDKQIKLAQSRVRVVGQEREIAVMQADHADEVVEFLNGKFTSLELYDWMSGILEGVCRYFLQQTTAVARLAENQLAFERQQVPPAFIQSDYWSAPLEGVANMTADGAAPDRRGLTGSARLLQDIYRLDQYAFETDRRRQQLTKTISLARFDPVTFQHFRQTGVMIFATPSVMFDRDFPGHYLRLIKRVRTSVIALIPPTDGIKATLMTLGISRVVIGGDLFQTTVVNRGPESVALTSPINATGLFELEAQNQGEMLFPFEGLGVDTRWEFRMPKAANLFDYNTIADVLLTVEYTALDSPVYRTQIIRQLDRNISVERPFSFRHQFADQWYDLNNSDLVAPPQQPMVVRFTTRPEDFPPNVFELSIQHVTLLIACKQGTAREIEVRYLRFTEAGQTGEVGGSASAPDGLLSTRQANAASWAAMLGKSPIGDWELALPDTQEMRDRFQNGEIEDILFVLTFGGTTPEWPG